MKFLIILTTLFVFAESCGDTSTSCSAWVANGFCSSTFYTTAQKTQYCGASCNLCSATATTTAAASSSSCTDSASACSSWVANGFCTNSFYTTAQKTQYCAKSCGLCSSSDTTAASATTAASSDSSDSSDTTEASSDATTAAAAAATTTAATTCADSVTTCAAWVANGYCTNSFYTDAERKVYCAKSCNLC